MPETKDGAQATARTPRQDSTGEAARLYAERSQRIADAMALRQPDRVPLIYNSQFWLAAYSGISFRQAMYDYEALAAATRKVVLDFEPDAYVSPFPGLAIGPVLDQSGFRALEWPGHGVPDDRPYQYLDREYMTADEYDAFIANPNWYIFTRYLPRVSEAYVLLAKLPDLAGSTFVRHWSCRPGSSATRRSPLHSAGSSRPARRRSGRPIAPLPFMRNWRRWASRSGRHASCACPYDYFADFLRGSKGAMLDLRRRGDQLLAAMEKVIPLLISEAMASADRNDGKIVFFPLHWGLGGFMSLEHFKIFYWPQLRQMMMGLVSPRLHPHGVLGGRLRLAARDHRRYTARHLRLLLRANRHVQGEGGPRQHHLPARQCSALYALHRLARRGARILSQAHRCGGQGRWLSPRRRHGHPGRGAARNVRAITRPRRPTAATTDGAAGRDSTIGDARGMR